MSAATRHAGRRDQQRSSDAWLNSPLQWLDMTSAQSMFVWDNWNGSTGLLHVWWRWWSRGVGSQGANTKYVDSGLYWAGYTTLVDNEAGINVLIHAVFGLFGVYFPR